MYSNQRIKRFVAGIMLLLFAMSITPRQLLHDTVTGHKHNIAKFEGDENFDSARTNFQCNWNEQVAESPFTGHQGFHMDHPAIVYFSYNHYYTHTYYSAFHFYSSLRGPPSLV